MSFETCCLALVYFLLLHQAKGSGIQPSSTSTIEYFGLQMPICRGRFCENRCLNGKIKISGKRMGCFCDRVCMVYGDCCPDFYSVCLKHDHSSPSIRPGNYEWVASQVEIMTNSSSMFRLLMVLFSYKMCITVDIRPYSEHIWIVAECPPSHNVSTVAYKCHNPHADVIGSVPATHVIYRFITFRNVFCALCHDVPVNDLQIWEASLECKPDIQKENISSDTLLDFLSDDKCSLALQFPKTTGFRYCITSDMADSIFIKRNDKVFLRNLLQMTTSVTTATTFTSSSNYTINITNQISNATSYTSNSETLIPTVTTSTLSSNYTMISVTTQTTNVTSDDLETPIRILELCGSYRYPVSVSCNLSRNVHCGYLKNDAVLVNQYRCRRCYQNVGGNLFVSLGVLFSFNEHGVAFCSSATTCKRLVHKLCPVDEVYDYYLDQCRQLICPVGMSPINGSCTINTTLVGDLRHQIFPNRFQMIFLNITFGNDSCSLKENNFLEVMDYSFLGLSNEAYLKSERNIGKNLKSISNKRPRQETITLVVSSCSENGQNKTNRGVRNYTYSLQFLNVLFSILRENHLGGNITEVTVSTFPANEDLGCENNTNIGNENGTLEKMNEVWFVHHDRLYYPLENIPFTINIGLNNESRASLVDYVICEKRMLDCPMISFRENATEINNHTLHILGTDLYFYFGSFVIYEGLVYVCSNFTRSYIANETVHFFNFNQVQGLLTLVCSVVSVSSLALTIVVYSVLPELRNVPGKIVMSVSLSLMTSQTLLLLSNKAVGLLCKALGIALHWAWLSTFMWMTMMATNLAKTFTAKSTAQQNHKSFSFYATITASLPTFIVILCVAVDMADIPTNMSIGYGDKGVCWISNKKALLIVFGIPLAILLLVNIVCFVITTWSIERSMNISKMATSTRKERVKCIIYCKLIIIMGLMWAFGFAAAFSKSDELWYVFIVLNGSQGLYICICFVFNRRILRLLKTKMIKSNRALGNESRILSHESRTLSSQM